jgi:hypothetical protein
LTYAVGSGPPLKSLVPGWGVLGAAVIFGETAGAHRFRSKDAYARSPRSRAMHRACQTRPTNPISRDRRRGPGRYPSCGRSHADGVAGRAAERGLFRPVPASSWSTKAP